MHGIGACSKALERLGIDLEIVDAVEIDKYAIASFNAIHGTNFEPQDITKWDKNYENIDIITHGSPCQDFSVAGKQAGGDKDSGTRSSLMYETIRIVEKIKPKYVLWENVKNVLSKKHRHNFDNYLEKMSELGYTNYYQVLNAKDYGIPQNRERVFTISILGNENYKFPIENNCNNKINRKYGLYNQATRWGVYDKNGLAPTLTASMGIGGGHIPMIENFEFPPQEELKLKLKDILEDEVDEKYYLDKEKIIKIQNSSFMQEKKRIQDKECCDTLLARDWKGPKCVQVGELDIKGHDCIKRVYLTHGISPTLTDIQGGNRQPKVKVERTPLKFLNRNQRNIKGDYSFCVDNCNTGGVKEIYEDNFRIRKLTPKECWRLMGFDDEDFEKAKLIPTSNTQLYKQAGNSIVVNVLEKIFKELLK